MKNTGITIVYLGRRAETRRALSNLLRQAGYEVSTRPHTRLTTARLKQGGIVVTDARDRGRALGRDHGRDGPASHRGRAEGLTLLACRGSAPDAAEQGRKDRPSAAKVTRSLRELREAVNKTQTDVARSTSMSQPQLSRFEARRDHLTSTLRRYVRALGGEIEVVARLGPRRIVLRDV